MTPQTDPPGPPTSYYDPARRDPALSRRPLNRRGDDWVAALLARAPICRVATAWDGQPFVNPTAFVYRPAREGRPHDLIFHSNLAGRVRANAEHDPRVCVEVSEMGALLPSNDPLELSVQYRSAVLFGRLELLEDEAARQALYDLSARFFPRLRPGAELRPIHDDDLARTSVYRVAIERWSGKENWAEQATQTDEWPPLPAELLGG